MVTGAGASDPVEAPAIVPQRAVLVLPTTAEFDSRTYRIASSLAARGHQVTVLARLRPGLPTHEAHPAGYEIRRVPVSAIDGLPFPRAVRAARVAVRRLQAWRTGTPYRPPGFPAAPGSPDARPVAPERLGLASVVRRLAIEFVRRLAIPLTVRSQSRESLRVAPKSDLYHGMAYMGIPVALALAKRDGARVVYDARDIYIDAANLAKMQGPMRRLIARAERRWARAADRVITVNRPYAEVMARRWSIPSPLIVMNCSYKTLVAEPRPRRFHEVLGLDPGTKVVLYQGGFSPDRGIEQLIEAIPGIPGAVLVLLGYGSLEEELAARASEPSLVELVHVLPAVPPTELVEWVASADVVAMPIQPTTLNHRLTTPNKLFEAFAAGVPVVASDLPGMAPTVREPDAGLLVDPTNPAEIADACRKLLAEGPAEAAARRARITAAAHATFNWERQVRILLDEYERLTGKPW